ncbi:hypothetical protein IV203_037615 [Nitzschia inconspicua]|uniref:Sulfotransferase n=1 Tax=Nitzschia inconspicua TaxID=303405 RepID=A0A9K3LMH3_9STRA|nr:hypothetical protein IV203_037615 [Nitzschia inconspicua]
MSSPQEQRHCNVTKWLIVAFLAGMTILSFQTSTKITSEFNLAENIRFDMLSSYVSSKTLMGVDDNVRNELSSPEGSPDSSNDDTLPKEIMLMLPQEQIEWMKNRTAYFHSFYEIPFDTGAEEKLHSPADTNGPILDFVVAGFPKCGTTTLMANLAQLAPMPEAKDVCTPARRTVLYAYKNWPIEYGQIDQFIDSASASATTTIENYGKLFRSSKCPQFIEEGWVQQFDRFLPKTKLIVGIRHPVLWFLSFWKMQGRSTPYELMGMCPCNINREGMRRGNNTCSQCRGSCPKRQLYCLGRARFHLPLARLGKTALSEDERQLLAPLDIDGGKNLISFNISNSVFLFDQTELRQGYLWKSLAQFLGVSYIPHSKFQGSVGHGKNYTLCEPHYDSFRSKLMPYSYELWMQKYFLPVAEDPNRPDVMVADAGRLSDILKSYLEDPCGRLTRTSNGTFVLKTTI